MDVNTNIPRIIRRNLFSKNLNGLWIKWGVYNDISGLENITNLEYLHLGGGVSLENISKLSKLTKLRALETQNLFNIHDYSLLTNLKHLIDLEIKGYPVDNTLPILDNS